MYQIDAFKRAINEPVSWLHPTGPLVVPGRASRSLSGWPSLSLFMSGSIMAARFTFISILLGALATAAAQGAFNGLAHTHTRTDGQAGF